MVDVIVVGCGPCGIAVSAEAKAHGLSCKIFDKGSVADAIRRYPLQMTFFSTAENIAVANVPFTINQPKATREEALNYYRMVIEQHQLDVHLNEEVLKVEKGADGLFIVQTSKENYKAKKVVMAIGYFDVPRTLTVPGAGLPHVKNYFDEPYPYMLQKVVIVGAGNTAVGAALDLMRHGVDVTMIIRKEDFKPTAKYWLLPDMRNRVKEGKIKAYFNSTVTEIKPYSILFEEEGVQKEIEADAVLALTGYLPDTNLLASMGIVINNDYEPIFNEDTFETGVKGLYVAGTVISGCHTEKVYIENGRLHAKPIVEDILKTV